jgi:hypothetical protein
LTWNKRSSSWKKYFRNGENTCFFFLIVWLINLICSFRGDVDSRRWWDNLSKLKLMINSTATSIY